MPAEVALCRCGASANKPHCDGAHAGNSFSSSKLEGRTPDRRSSYAGNGITVHDNRGLCAHAGICTDALPTVWRMREEPWIQPEGASVEEVIEVIQSCPSGALTYSIDEAAAASEPEREPAVLVAKNGPYIVTGGRRARRRALRGGRLFRALHPVPLWRLQEQAFLRRRALGSRVSGRRQLSASSGSRGSAGSQARSALLPILLVQFVGTLGFRRRASLPRLPRDEVGRQRDRLRFDRRHLLRLPAGGGGRAWTMVGSLREASGAPPQPDWNAGLVVPLSGRVPASDRHTVRGRRALRRRLYADSTARGRLHRARGGRPHRWERVRCQRLPGRRHGGRGAQLEVRSDGPVGQPGFHPRTGPGRIAGSHSHGRAPTCRRCRFDFARGHARHRVPTARVPSLRVEGGPSSSVRRVFGQEHRDCFRLYAERRPSLGELLRTEGLGRVLGIYFLVMLGFNFFYVAFPVRAARTLSWSSRRRACSSRS